MNLPRIQGEAALPIPKRARPNLITQVQLKINEAAQEAIRSPSPLVLRLRNPSPPPRIDVRDQTITLVKELLASGLCTQKECDQLLKFLREFESAKKSQYYMDLTELLMEILGPILDRNEDLGPAYQKVHEMVREEVAAMTETMTMDAWIVQFTEIRRANETLVPDIERIALQYRQRLQIAQKNCDTLLDTHHKTFLDLRARAAACSQSLGEKEKEALTATHSLVQQRDGLESSWTQGVRPQVDSVNAIRARAAEDRRKLFNQAERLLQ